MKEKRIKNKLGHTLHLYVWDKVDNPKGVLQIIHGVNEHGLRYKEFAEYLNTQGFIVYCHDQTSQGKSRTKLDGDIVYFGKNGKDNLKFGVQAVYKQIKIDYVNLPINAFGHSLGASVLRYCLIGYETHYEHVVLSGNGLSEVKGLGLIIFIGKIMSIFKKKKQSKFFDNLFRKTQLKLRDKTEIDHFIEWLTRDKKRNEIDKKDKYLFISLSVGAFVDILELIKIVNNKNNILRMSKDTKFLLLSGTHDPATDFGEGTKELNSYLNSISIKSVLKLYPEGRHDSIQEINRLEIFKDISEFLTK